jgi:hypothetical protein
MLVIFHADAGALSGWRVKNLKLDGRVGGPICPPIWRISKPPGSAEVEWETVWVRVVGNCRHSFTNALAVRLRQS